jgi:hypothetical protein
MCCKAKLLFLCGKMAAGKSTLSRELAERENAVLLVQDEFLEKRGQDPLLLQMAPDPLFLKQTKAKLDAESLVS